MWESQLPGMESCETSCGFPLLCALCILQVARFGPVVETGGPVAILKQLRIRFGGAFSAVCGVGVRTTGPSQRQKEAMHGFFHVFFIFVKFLTDV